VRDDRIRLQDILEAVEQIERYAARGRAGFDQDELVQTWIIHYLSILGEAASGLSAEFRKQHPERAWAEAVGRRNILIHRYFGIELDLVWRVVEHDLPPVEEDDSGYSRWGESGVRDPVGRGIVFSQSGGSSTG
jgi:uncharacterized protein with HEPN domain